MWSCRRSPSTAMRRSMTAAGTVSIHVRIMTRYPVFRIPDRKNEIHIEHFPALDLESNSAISLQFKQFVYWRSNHSVAGMTFMV